jgi:hypothetical protein
MLLPIIDVENANFNLFNPNKGGEFVHMVDLSCSGEPQVIYSDKVNHITFGSCLPDINNFKNEMVDVSYKASILNYDQPVAAAVDAAVAVLSFLTTKGIEEYHVAPLPEGGIGFEFTNNSTYYNIKLDNELDGVLYKEAPNQLPAGWDLTFNSLLNKLNTEV